MTDPRLVEAAEWLERMERDATPAARSAFEAWRHAAGNEAAWQSVVATRDIVTPLADDPDLIAMRDAARERLDETSGRHWHWMYAAAAAFLLTLLPLHAWYKSSGFMTPAGPPDRVYVTAVGQRLTAQLPDGSRLTLNSASRLRVLYTPTERRLVLEEGQGLFRVAKGQLRPFLVQSGTETVTAHGTLFDVRKTGDAIQVALVEGSVSVASDRDDRVPVTMRPNEVLKTSADGYSVRRMPGAAESVASWSTGHLVFVNETLADAVGEMNRYAGPRIIIADDRVGRLRISGSFRVGDVQPFVDALQIGFPVKIDHRSNGNIALSSTS